MQFSPQQRREQLGLFNMAEAARELNIDYDDLYSDVWFKRVISPTTVMFRRAYYTTADLKKLESIYKSKNNN